MATVKYCVEWLDKRGDRTGDVWSSDPGAVGHPVTGHSGPVQGSGRLNTGTVGVFLSTAVCVSIAANTESSQYRIRRWSDSA